MSYGINKPLAIFYHKNTTVINILKKFNNSNNNNSFFYLQVANSPSKPRFKANLFERISESRLQFEARKVSQCREKSK